MQNEKAYTLKELASPMCPIPSTASISFSIAGEKANSFSLPPYLYYMGKAKRLAKLGIDDEREALNGGYLDLQRALVDEFREEARGVHRDIVKQGVNLDNYVSATIQSRLLYRIFSEKVPANEPLVKIAAEPINASRSRKNITVPNYLYQRLIDLLGGKRDARQQIHAFTFDIKTELQNAGFIDSANKLIGDAAHSSWSRKVHNVIFFHLLKMSNVPELNSTPSVLSVKMVRDRKIETSSS
jgi:hypothetical protein